MKKGLFTLAALATIMASCSSDDALVDENVQNNNDTQVAIGFSTFTNKATRAENSSETAQLGLADHHSTFAVWGYKDVQTGYVFGTLTTAGQKVEYASSAWSYSPMRFWDKNSNSYEFYAAAPETTAAPLWTLNVNTDAQNDDYFTLADVTLTNSTLASTSYVESMKDQSNTDYMIADPKNVALADYGTVQLDFNHILSRLNVTVKKGSTLDAAGDDGKLAITSLTVYNMPAKGSFDEHLASGTTLKNGTDTRWTAASTPVLVDYTGNALADVTTTKSYIMQSLIMPQTVGYDATVTKDGKYTAGKVALDTDAAPYIKLVYTIGKTSPETFTAYYNLASLFGTTGLKFSEGWQNTLNITIDANAIVFNPEVYNWEDTTDGALNIQ